jgi:cytoskeletal protein CcmA (bactofilin family)
MATFNNGESLSSVRTKINDVIDKIDGNATIPNNVDITGDITVSGTVDGRDVATDGTKLDGIEASADVTDATNVAAAGAAMETGADFTGNVTFSTGIDVTGSVTADALTVDGAADINGDLEVGAGGTGTKLLQINGSGSSTSVMDLEMRGGGTGNPTTILRHTSSTKDFSLLTGNYGSELTRLSVTEGGDITFFDSAGSSQSFFWDASVEGLGIGDASFTNKLNVTGAMASAGTPLVQLSENSGGARDGLYLDYAGTTNSAVYSLKIADASKTHIAVRGDGNVGIGTDSPSALLQVEGSDGVAGGAIMYTASGVASGYMSADAAGLCLATDTAGITFRTGVTGADPTDTGTERMRIDSSGNVNLKGLSNGRLNFAGGNTSGGSKIQAWNDAGNANGYLAIEGYSSEYARFDSSGNLLVGTTDLTLYDETNGGETGFALRPDGRLYNATQGNTSAIFNRLGTGGTENGTILQLRSNGSTVGSIGSASGATTYIDGGSQFAGLQFGGDGSTEGRITPRRNGAGADASTDLGTSSLRFKDLYLSNAVVQDGVKATTTATTQVAIETFAHADHDGAKVVITAATSADTYVTELLIATNGTTAVATEYGQIGTGSALATYDVDISGTDVRILATPASTTSTTFRVAMTLT